MQFSDILREYSIPFKNEGRYTRPGWLQLFCPFCKGGSDPDKPYMGYCIAGNFCSCWRCGNHRAGDTLAELTGLSIKQALALLNELDRPTRLTQKRPTAGKLELPKWLGPLLPAHRAYLRGRGFDPKHLERLWQLRGIGISLKLPWRIFIPIIQMGEIVSYTTRSISDDGIRYVSAAPHQEIISHKEVLYGEDYCRHAVVVVEGPTDAWRIGPGAVAVLGTKFTPAQVSLIAKYPVRAICFDPETAAQQQAQELCSQLEPLDGETYNIVLDTGDPGEASLKEIRSIRKHFLE